MNKKMELIQEIKNGTTGFRGNWCLSIARFHFLQEKQ